MDKFQVVTLILLGTFALTVLLTVWLTKRAAPDKRFYWFVGCCVVAIFFIGLIPALTSIVVSLCILAFIASDDNKPLNDVGEGLLTVFGSSVQLAFMGLYLLLGVGGLYWLWIAIKIESFMMFIVGLFPLFYIVTAPVGAYSLVFGTPEWVFSWFG